MGRRKRELRITRQQKGRKGRRRETGQLVEMQGRLWEAIRNIIKRRSSDCKIELVKLVDYISKLFHRNKGMVPLRETGPSIHGRTRVV